LDRASDYGSEGLRFDSSWLHFLLLDRIEGRFDPMALLIASRPFF